MDPTVAPLRLRTEKIIKKIPGKEPTRLPKEKDGYLDKLSAKSTAELKELLERQVKVLTNKFLVSKLPDKGAQVTKTKQRIEEELKSRDGVDTTVDMLSKMTLSQLNALEWTGHCRPGHSSEKTDMNLDEDETNPLQILATHSGVTSQQKQIRIEEPEEVFVKPEDIEEAMEIRESVGSVSPASKLGSDVDKPVVPALTDEPEPYAHIICQRFGHRDGRDRFKPNKPLKPFTGEFPMKPPGRISSKPARWEETNVTPPPPIHGDAKLLTLEESLELQREQAHKLKKVQAEHAMQKLREMQGLGTFGALPSGVRSSMAYRRGRGEESSSESEAEIDEQELEECHDDDMRDNDTAVVYNVVS